MSKAQEIFAELQFLLKEYEDIIDDIKEEMGNMELVGICRKCQYPGCRCEDEIKS